MRKVHELKIWPQYYKHVVAGSKTFEHRKYDRDFQFGDGVLLKEWDPERNYTDASLRQLGPPKGYTGAERIFRIGYILDLGDETCIFSLLPIEEQ